MSDAEWIMKQQIQIKDAEIERLREFLHGRVEFRDKIINELRGEVERLRELLFRIENHYEHSVGGDDDTQEDFEFREVVCRIKKEVGESTPVWNTNKKIIRPNPAKTKP